MQHRFCARREEYSALSRAAIWAAMGIDFNRRFLWRGMGGTCAKLRILPALHAKAMWDTVKLLLRFLCRIHKLSRERQKINIVFFSFFNFWMMDGYPLMESFIARVDMDCFKKNEMNHNVEITCCRGSTLDLQVRHMLGRALCNTASWHRKLQCSEHITTVSNPFAHHCQIVVD